MSMMLSKTYDALVSAGAPAEKAREAAEELAAYDNRLSGIETELKLLKWMTTTTLAGVITLLVKAFT